MLTVETPKTDLREVGMTKVEREKVAARRARRKREKCLEDERRDHDTMMAAWRREKVELLVKGEDIRKAMPPMVFPRMCY